MSRRGPLADLTEYARLTGTLQDAGCAATEIARFWLVGDRWRLQAAFGRPESSDSRVFARNIRAFGAPVQRMIGSLRIAVVGCGGTGSAVAEQLVRLGARDLLLVDADILREACTPPSGSADDLEVVVPNAAKSAATLVALGADRILMSDSSELGPIDPQLQISDGGSVPVFALIRAYEEAERRCAQHPDNRAFAAELGKFDAILIAEMRQAVDRARMCAERLLKRQGANYTAVSTALMDVDRFPSHGQMVDWRTAKDIGIPHVHHLPRNDPLWRLYWRLYRYLLPVSGSDGRVLESLDRTVTASGPGGG